MIPMRHIKITESAWNHTVGTQWSSNYTTHILINTVFVGEDLSRSSSIGAHVYRELQGLGNHSRAVEIIYGHGQLLSTQTTAPLTLATKKNKKERKIETQKTSFPCFLFGQQQHVTMIWPIALGKAQRQHSSTIRKSFPLNLSLRLHPTWHKEAMSESWQSSWNHEDPSSEDKPNETEKEPGLSQDFLSQQIDLPWNCSIFSLLVIW